MATAADGAGTVWVDVRGDTTQLGRDIEAQARSAGRAISSSLGSGARTVLGDLGSVAGAAALGVAGIGLAAAKVAANFDQAMSGVGAVANASAEEMDKLREAALEAGASTSFSATEAAAAQGELVKAGVSVSDTLGGALTGALGLAAAGQLELADAATISAQAMNLFSLGGEDVTHIADVLAAGANKSAADVSTLGDALRQGGLVAAQTGLDLEDTVGVLSMFADSALVGSDAGTSLKTMLQRLTPQSKEAATKMAELGLAFFDAEGQFVGIDSVAQQLQDSLGGLSDEQRNAALATLFGSDAVRAASILMEGGAAKVNEYTAAVNDQGAASRMAAEQLDNLKGDVEEFSGAIETALIRIGDLSTPALRGVTQGATGFVDVFNEFATTPTWGAIESNVAELSDSFGGLFDDMADRMDEFLSGISPADIDRVFGKITDGAATVRDSIAGLEGVIGGLGLSLSTMALRSIPLVGGLVPAIAPVTGVLGGLVLGSEDGRDALKSLGERFGEVAQTQGPQLARSLGGLADTLSGSLAGALEGIGGAAADAAETLGPVLADAIDTLGPPLGDLIESAGELVEAVLPGLADLAGTVLPPAIGALGGVLDVAAGAVGLLADNADLLMPVLAGLAAWKASSSLSGLGSTLLGIGGSLKTAASDFGTFFGVLRSEGQTVGQSLRGAASASAGLSGGLAGVLNPALLGVTAAAAVGVGVWQAWQTNVKRVEEESRALSDTLIAQGKDVLPQLATSFRNILDTRDSFDESFSKTGIAIEKVTRIVDESTGEFDRFRKSFQDLAGEDPMTLIQDPELQREALAGLSAETRGVIESMMEMREAGNLTDNEFRESVDAMVDLDKQAMNTATSIESMATEFSKSAEDVKLSADAQRHLATALDDNAPLQARRDALSALAEAYPDVASKAGVAIDGVTGSTEDLEAATERTVSALQALQGELDSLSGARRDADEAERRLADATRATAKSFSEGSGIDVTAEAGSRNAAAIQSQIEAAEGLAEVLATLDPTGRAATEVLQGQADALVKMRDEGKLSADEYQHLIDTYSLTPEQITTTVSADTANAKVNIEQLRSDIQSLPGATEAQKLWLQTWVDQGKYAEAAAAMAAIAQERTMRLKVEAYWDALPQWLRPFGRRDGGSPFAGIKGVGSARVPGHADGGMAAPGWALVGERGPELVNFDRPGYVYDAQQTSRMLDGKSRSGAEFSDAAIEKLLAAIERRGSTTINVNGVTGRDRELGRTVSDTLWLAGR